MKFLLDESAELRLSSLLQREGHDVKAVAHDYPHGLPDDDMLALARDEQRILITNDRDFGELVFRHRLAHSGVIFFRMRDQATTTKLARMQTLLQDYADQLDQFVAVTDRQVRVRRTRGQ